MDSQSTNNTELNGVRCYCKPGYEGSRCEKGYKDTKI